jgi:hypothetical protein
MLQVGFRCRMVSFQAGRSAKIYNRYWRCIRVCRRRATAATRCIILMFALWLTSLAPTSQPCAAATPALVAQKHIRSLMLSPKDIPLDVILHNLECSPSTGPVPPAGRDKGSYWFKQHFSGPPIAGPATMQESYGVDVEVGIATSAVAAGQAVERIVNSMAVILPESRDRRKHSFADRAWDAGNGICFSRRNVAATIYTSEDEMSIPGLTLKLARLIGRKIDAAAAGRPEPAPELPPVVRRDLYACWSLPLVNQMLQRPARNTVILKCGDRPPVSMWVDGLPGKDMTVRLQPLAAAMSHNRYYKSGSKQARAQFAGRRMVFTAGSTVVQVDGRPIRLSRPVAFRKGTVLIPLSFVDKAFGKRITWRMNGKIAIGNM